MSDFKFNPEVLKWAREKRFGASFEALVSRWAKSWTEASPELIAEWEKGTSQPTFVQIRKLAEIYKRPLAVFFLESPPDEKANPPDLRTIGSHDNKSLSPEGLLAIRKARRIQAISAALLDDLGEQPSFKYRRHTSGEDPSELAERVRGELALSLHDQFRARTFEDFFEYVRERIESTGAIVLRSGLHDSFPTADCRAFSFTDQLPYLILVNNKDTEGAKNFSLAHEFAHLLLRAPSICNDFKAFGSRKGINAVEVFCNQFAASFLVPKGALLQHKTLRSMSEIAPEEIDTIANRLALDFKVSRVVVLRRLLTLDLIPHALYKNKVRAWDDEPPVPRRKGGRFSLRSTLLKNGVAFSSLVFEAYRKKTISYAGVSDYLGLKTKHLPGFEKLINSHAG